MEMFGFQKKKIQKSKIDMPQQPPTKKILKFKFNFTKKTQLSLKHQNKGEFVTLDNSEFFNAQQR